MLLTRARLRRRLVLLLAVAAGCGLTADRATPIASLRARATQLDGHEVTVRGQVKGVVKLPFVPSHVR